MIDHPSTSGEESEMDNPYDSSHTTDLAPLRSSPVNASGTMVVIGMLGLGLVVAAILMSGIVTGIFLPVREPSVERVPVVPATLPPEIPALTPDPH